MVQCTGDDIAVVNGSGHMIGDEADEVKGNATNGNIWYLPGLPIRVDANSFIIICGIGAGNVENLLRITGSIPNL